MHYATFYQSALHTNDMGMSHRRAVVLFHVDSSEKGFMVVTFYPDLPVKRCEEDRA